MEVPIALKHTKTYSFCKFPAGADRVQPGATFCICNKTYKNICLCNNCIGCRSGVSGCHWKTIAKRTWPIALKHTKTHSFCKFPPGADRVQPGLFEFAIKHIKKHMFVQQLHRVPFGCKRVQPQEELVEISNAEPGVAGCSLRRKWWTPARPSECAALGGNGSMG